MFFIDKARKALDDFVIFDEAIGESLKVVNESDTMVVVTADHSHTFTIGGNSMRGNPIYGRKKKTKNSLYFLLFILILRVFKGLALARNANVSDANLTFTSILYGNGPGGLKSIRTRNLTNEETRIMRRIFYLECFFFLVLFSFLLLYRRTELHPRGVRVQEERHARSRRRGHLRLRTHELLVLAHRRAELHHSRHGIQRLYKRNLFL